MKTRKICFSLLMLVGVLFPDLLRAQNVGININAAQASILNGQEGALDVTLCNTDIQPISAPANCLRALVSFPINLTVLNITKVDGTPATDFDIMFLTNDDSEGSHNVKVQYKNTLANFDCITFRIHVQGNAVGAGSILGNLSFAFPLVTNSPLDDNSTSSIPVMVNLPVTLRDFNAKKQENSAVLSWSTTEETNSDRFDVQRSINGKEWKTILTVKAAGESNLIREYSTLDKKPLYGENLYRLKMIDKDASTAFSSVRSLKFDDVRSAVYPNPVADFLYLSTDDWETVVTVKIHDASGRAVYDSGKNPKSTIDVRSFATGIYNVRIKHVNGSESNHRIAVTK